MNENQLKTKIFMLRTVDLALVISVVMTVVYTVFYAQEKGIMTIICLAGVFLLNTFGRISSNKIALMRVHLTILDRKRKQQEHATLISSRHANTRVSSNTVNQTNATTSR